jgi:hypothetical protein
VGGLSDSASTSCKTFWTKSTIHFISVEMIHWIDNQLQEIRHFLDIIQNCSQCSVQPSANLEPQFRVLYYLRKIQWQYNQQRYLLDRQILTLEMAAIAITPPYSNIKQNQTVNQKSLISSSHLGSNQYHYQH